MRRRSLYKPGSTSNTGNKKKQLPLLLECRLPRAILLKPQPIRLLLIEEEAIQHHQHLRQSLTHAEHSYRTTVQQEARIYSEELHHELQYHQTAQAQAESLLAAERQRAEHTLHEQATHWQSALRNVSEWGETAVEQERSESVEREVQLNIFRIELHDAQEELRNWDDWYSSGIVPEAETSLQAEEEEGSSSLPVPDTSRPVQGAPAPLTPPVLQTQPLLARHARHLPPPVLPFQDFAARVAETALEREVAEEQQAARRVLEESEEQAHHSHTATADELEQARQTIRLLEQGQVGSGAPSFTPTLTPPGGGYASHLTLGQPVPALLYLRAVPEPRGWLPERDFNNRRLYLLLLYCSLRV